jgi:hypothetical protein
VKQSISENDVMIEMQEEKKKSPSSPSKNDE